MLREQDIDQIAETIRTEGAISIWYAAHYVELRESFIDEHQYKDASKLRPVQVIVKGVRNALFEVYNQKKNPDNYHTETETSMYTPLTTYITLYTVPNITEGNKDFNSRMPSVIYGYTRKEIDRRSSLSSIVYNEPSPVKEYYTNSPKYLGEVVNALKYNIAGEGLVDLSAWKYIDLADDYETIDGTKFKYVTSDYYILNVSNFPRVEFPLINVKEKCAYFMDAIDCWDYCQQLEA